MTLLQSPTRPKHALSVITILIVIVLYGNPNTINISVSLPLHHTGYLAPFCHLIKKEELRWCYLLAANYKEPNGSIFGNAFLEAIF